MHPEHARLIEDLRALAPKTRRLETAAYLGADSEVLGVPVPARRALAKAWVDQRRDAPPAEILAVVESLAGAATFDEKTLGALILGLHRPARQAVRPEDLERWLGAMRGWAEVDHLCQNLFPPEQMLADWPAWKAAIRRMAGDPVIARRRASLVLLTGPARRSPDVRFADLAFANIEALKAERDILITKAVSWLLRALTAHHAAAVAAYLDANAASLPAIAVRETRTKLATGRKTA
ncbi:DNA alkylation repair protein [Phenylobacterium sp. J367]|uniref:DNA alkylation repair protein n=1 Tax=Phenylobacterium sp. J367 TaxID=2898435 RepID=UPI002151D9C8|nr:DNA alkylation repair protein [Phenylobacterium sp. J367]MCR5880510.1 DNA alkylation repair protein [Phenylobacterium sp. J367]